MSADANDLRFFYSEHLGNSQEVALSGTSNRSTVLDPGRYIVRVRGAVGAALAWLTQGHETINAVAAAPNTPFVLNGTVSTESDAAAANTPLATFMVKGGNGKDAYLAGILNAGTATMVITKISRDKS